MRKIEGKAKGLTVYIGETDHWHGKPLYAAIVEEARKDGLAGATVTRGIMGFGAKSHLHTASILRLSEDLPVVIQIVDEAARIEIFAKKLDEMVTGGLVVTWDLSVERFVHASE